MIWELAAEPRIIRLDSQLDKPALLEACRESRDLMRRRCRKYYGLVDGRGGNKFVLFVDPTRDILHLSPLIIPFVLRLHGAVHSFSDVNLGAVETLRDDVFADELLADVQHVMLDIGVSNETSMPVQRDNWMWVYIDLLKLLPSLKEILLLARDRPLMSENVEWCYNFTTRLSMSVDADGRVGRVCKPKETKMHRQEKIWTYCALDGIKESKAGWDSAYQPRVENETEIASEPSKRRIPPSISFLRRMPARGKTAMTPEKLRKQNW